MVWLGFIFEGAPSNGKDETGVRKLCFGNWGYEYHGYGYGLHEWNEHEHSDEGIDGRGRCMSKSRRGEENADNRSMSFWRDR